MVKGKLKKINSSARNSTENWQYVTIKKNNKTQ